MKVGLVIRGNLSFPSGGFLYDRQLVGTLRQAGDTVEVISLPWDGYAAGLARGVDPRLHARLRAWRGDVLLQDELAHPVLAPVNRALRRDARAPIVSIVHHLRVSERLGALAAAAARTAESAYLRSVDAFVFNGTVTRSTVEALIGAGAPGIIAPPGGDRLGPGLTEARVVSRAREGGALRILFVGNLIPRKGLLVLLQALASLSRETWSLTVAGSPHVDRAHAREVRRFVDTNGLGANVHLAGHLEDGDLARQLAAAHVLAVPSEYEGFGIAYLEAMGFGVVPIGSSAGGATELIQDGTSGYLVPPGDWQALARVLGILAADRSTLQAVAVGALGRFQEFPGWEPRMLEVRSWLASLAAIWPAELHLAASARPG